MAGKIAALLCALALIGVGFSDAMGWDSILLVTPNPGAADSFPDASCTDDSFCMLVWQYGLMSGTEISYASWDGNGWASNFITMGTGMEAHAHPMVSCTSSSFCMAVWEYDDAGTRQVYYSDWDGGAWSAPVALTSGGDSQTMPTIGCAEEGGVPWCMAAYEDGDGAGPRLSYWDYDQATGWNPMRGPAGTRLDSDSKPDWRPDIDCKMDFMNQKFCVAAYTEEDSDEGGLLRIEGRRWDGNTWTALGYFAAADAQNRDFSAVACGAEMGGGAEYCMAVWENLDSGSVEYNTETYDGGDSIGSESQVTGNSLGGKPDVSCSHYTTNSLNFTVTWTQEINGQDEIVGTRWDGGSWNPDPPTNISNHSSADANSTVSMPSDNWAMCAFMHSNPEIYYSTGNEIMGNSPPINFAADDNGATSVSNFTDVLISATWTDPGDTVGLYVDDDPSFANCGQASTSGCYCTDLGKTGGSGQCYIDTAKQSGAITWYARACDSQWACSSTGSGGYTVTQVNKPSISAVTILPESPKTTDSLNCEFGAEDADGDALHANITWFVNASGPADDPANFARVVQYNMTNTPLRNDGTTNETSPGNGEVPDDHVYLKKGYVWKCQMVVGDGTDAPYAAYNATKTIGNTVARLNLGWNPQYPLTGNGIDCNATVIDPDYDDGTDSFKVGYNISYIRGGTTFPYRLNPEFSSYCSGNKCNASASSSATQVADEWLCRMNVSDESTSKAWQKKNTSSATIRAPESRCNAYLNCGEGTCENSRQFNISIKPFEWMAAIRSSYRVCWT